MSTDKIFKVTLLGMGTPTPSMERFSSSTLIEAGSETLSFDVGRGTTQRLWQLGIPLRQVTDVFLTHFQSHLVLLGSPTISAPTIAEVVALTRKNYSGQLEVGEDLMTVEISDTVNVRRFAAVTHR